MSVDTNVEFSVSGDYHSTLPLYLLTNHTNLLLFESEDKYGTSMALMLYLNLYDTVEVKAVDTENLGDPTLNSFEGRLLP